VYPASETVIDTAAVGDHPVGLAVVTTTQKIYVANLHSWSVTPLWLADRERAAPDIYVGAQACRVVADPAEARVYAANHLETDNGVAAIDSQTDQRLYWYERFNGTQGRYGIDVDPEANNLFVAARDAGLIAIQDADRPTADPQIVKLDPARVPFVVAFNPTTQHLFVTAPYDNKVVVLAPYSIEWTRAARLWYEGQQVSLIDRTNAGWIKEVSVGLGAEEGIAVNPDTGLVYVTNASSNTVSVLQDAATPAQIRWLRDIAVGDVPQGIAVDVVRNRVYVGNAGSRDVTVIDGATHAVIATIPLD
ncbi:MAG TPA: YncE family protein, partial [Anaerolineae bacterium]|nr:YncE family protein [Anaerolineae bacterium]